MKQFLATLFKYLLFFCLMMVVLKLVITDLKEFTKENKLEIVVCSQSDEGLVCK